MEPKRELPCGDSSFRKSLVLSYSSASVICHVMACALEANNYVIMTISTEGFFYSCVMFIYGFIRLFLYSCVFFAVSHHCHHLIVCVLFSDKFLTMCLVPFLYHE